MEIIIGIIAICIVLIIALIRGVNITIKHEYPEPVSISDPLYNKDGEAKEEVEDYLQEIVKEIHDIFQEDTIEG